VFGFTGRRFDLRRQGKLRCQRVIFDNGVFLLARIKFGSSGEDWGWEFLRYAKFYA
jgi:hypothetical protein